MEHRAQSPGHCGQDSSKTTSRMWSGRAEKDWDVSLGESGRCCHCWKLWEVNSPPRSTKPTWRGKAGHRGEFASAGIRSSSSSLLIQILLQHSCSGSIIPAPPNSEPRAVSPVSHPCFYVLLFHGAAARKTHLELSPQE